MPQPVSKGFIGLAQEATKGTWLTPVDYIPVTHFEFFDQVKYINDEAIRGSMVKVYNKVQGPIYSEFSFGGPVFPESIPRLLKGLMGDLVTTGAGAPYSHNFAVYNSTDGQPPAYSLTFFNGFNSRGFPGAQISELAFKFNPDGFMEYTCKGIAYPSAIQTTPIPNYSAPPPIANWTGSLTLATVLNAKLEDAEVTISRPVQPIHNLDATQGPYKIWAGPLSCKGKYVLVYEDDTDLTRYLTNTQPAAVLLFTVGAAATTRLLQFTMTKQAFDTAAKVVKSKDYYELDAPWEAVANTTDVGASAGYGPVKVQVQSAISAYTT